MEQRKFEFKPEFKAAIIETLSTLSFSNVHGMMNLLKREGNYTEQEANAIVGFLGEMAYRDVAHLFEAMPKMVKELASESEGPQSESAVEAPAEVEEQA
jgi:hypothetical protein